MNKEVLIENWSVIDGQRNQEFIAPECRLYKLHGNVYGHPGFNDGDPVNTGILIAVNIPDKTASTTNTKYRLGEPDPQFVEFLKERHKSINDLFSKEATYE